MATAAENITTTTTTTSPPKRVWTTLITNTDYLPGLLTLAYSLRRVGSAYPLVALYTDTFPPAGLAALRARGVAAQRIDYLLPTRGRDYSADPRFYDCWSKLTPFSLTQYDRVVQLDSDMLVLRNMDELMTLPLDPPDVAAAPAAAPATTTTTTITAAGPGPGLGPGAAPDNDPPAGASTRVFAASHACLCNPLGKAHYPADWVPAHCAFTAQHSDPARAQLEGLDPAHPRTLGILNGGLQVVNPSRQLFLRIVAHMDACGADMAFADQSLLSDLFRRRWVPLPYVYNALKTMRWPGVHDAVWRDDRVKNVHYILTPKPWEELDANGDCTSTDETHKWWADITKERKKAEREEGVPDDGF